MTYSLNIDQEFAIVNNLSLVQVSTLAAFMTLTVWSKTVAIDGFVWYQYSDERMSDDFPLLFGVAKRCYKNISELADMGFVELTKLGRVKYVRFTTRCADWNKKKERIWTNSPKTDSEKSENGLGNSPKLDFSNNNYNIINSNISDKAADGGLFPNTEDIEIKKKEHSRERKCLFANSKFYDFELFKKQFTDTEFENVDLFYYYNRLKNWSGGNDKKKCDWILTAKNWMMDDNEAGKLKKLQSEQTGLSPDAIEYLKDMAQ